MVKWVIGVRNQVPGNCCNAVGKILAGKAVSNFCSFTRRWIMVKLCLYLGQWRNGRRNGLKIRR